MDDNVSPAHHQIWSSCHWAGMIFQNQLHQYQLNKKFSHRKTHICVKMFQTHRGHPRHVPPSWSSRSVTGCAGSSSATQPCSSYRMGSCQPRTDRSDSESAFCLGCSVWPSRSAPSRNKAVWPSWRAPAGWIWTASPDPRHRTRRAAAGTASGSTRIRTECRTCCCSRGGKETSWCWVRSATGKGSQTLRCTLRGRSWRGASAASAGDGGAGSAGTPRSCRSTRPCPGAPERCGAE